MVTFFVMTVPVCHGIERLGYVGQTWSFPLFFRSKTSQDEVTYHIDTGYFLNEKLSAALSIDAQVNGLELFYLEFGPDFYPVQDTRLLPYISARLLYSMVPNGNAGWLANMGFETRIGNSSQIENLRLRVSSGMGQFFFNSNDTVFIELIRVGLIWSY